jgi:hypothetical protein
LIGQIARLDLAGRLVGIRALGHLNVFWRELDPKASAYKVELSRPRKLKKKR